MSIFRGTCIILLLSCFSTFGQQQEKQRVKKDSTTSFLPTGVRIGTDMVGIIKTGVQEGFSNQEIFADVDFYRYYVVTELGRYSRNLEISNGQYQNNGTYLRIGADVNFLKKDPERNMFFLGFRYGRTNYNEAVTYLSKTEYGEQLKVAENTGVNSGWLELTTGLRVRIWKFIWMGYTGRLKFSPSTPKDSPIAPYDIPGYGLTFKKPWWGFSYYVMMRIPFQKDSGQEKN